MKMTRNEKNKMMEFMASEMARNSSNMEEFIQMAMESEIGDKILQECSERTIVEMTIKKVLYAFIDNEEFFKKAKELIKFKIRGKEKNPKYIFIELCYNTTPLLACSLAKNEKIRKDILELYERYEHIFVEVNTQIETCDTWINTMIPFKNVEAYKKALVIIESIASEEREQVLPYNSSIINRSNYKELEISDIDVKLSMYKTHSVEICEEIKKDIQKEIRNLVMKANKKLCRDYKNVNRIDIQDHMCSVMYNQNNKEKNKSTMLTVICDLISIQFQKKLEGADVFEELSFDEKNVLVLCMMYIVNEFAENYNQPKEEIYTKEEKAEVRNFLETLSQGLDTSAYSFLFPLEGEHLERYLTSADFSRKDMQLLEKAYMKAKEDVPFADYVLPAAYILMLLRTVKTYAEGYENLLEQDEKNKYLLHKAEKITKELENKKQEYDELTNKHAINARLQQEKIKRLQAENEKLKKSLHKEGEKAKEHKKELLALREYVNSLHKEEIEENEITLCEKEERIRELRIVIVGGHQNWNNKMQAIFPEWKYVAEETKTVSEQFFNAAELVLIFDTHCNHALYCKVIKVIENGSAEIGYIGSSVNIEKTISNIYDIVLKKKLI